MELPGHIEAWLDDNLGVSPVIGVILMVAITVIVAAVIGATALGMGDRVSESPPQAQFTSEESELKVTPNGGNPGVLITTVTFTHESGEDIDAENLYITVNGDRGWDVFEQSSTPSGSEVHDCLSSPCSYTKNPFDDVGSSMAVGDSARVVVVDIQEYSDVWESDVPYSDGDIQPLFSFSTDGVEYITYNGAHDSGVEQHDVSLDSGDTVRLEWRINGKSTILDEYEV